MGRTSELSECGGILTAAKKPTHFYFRCFILVENMFLILSSFFIVSVILGEPGFDLRGKCSRLLKMDSETLILFGRCVYTQFFNLI